MCHRCRERLRKKILSILFLGCRFCVELLWLSGKKQTVLSDSGGRRKKNCLLKNEKIDLPEELRYPRIC